MHLFGLISFFAFLCIAFSAETNDRIPAVPLVVKTPYLSTWLTSANKQIVGEWAHFWNGGNIKGLTGLIKVDGKTYEFIGNPLQNDIGTKLKVVQKGLKVTPTQSIFTLEAGPVEITVNFFTPIDPTDLKLLSMPASYVKFNVRSTDKAKHKVEVYVEITAEWAGGDSKEIATWSFENKVGGVLHNYDIKLQNQHVFDEFNDMAKWGTIKFFTDANSTYQTGEAVHVRSAFVKNSTLNNVVDKNFRPISQNFPVFAYSHDLGSVDDMDHSFHVGFAHVRHPAIELATTTVNSLWESYFKNDSNAMITFFFNDRVHALERANALDSRLTKEAHAVGGDSYVKIISAAVRQAFGGIELVGTIERPLMMLKEISSDGNCQTVDVLYPHFPIVLYLNPLLLKLELEPLFDNMEAGLFPHKYSMHDLGTHYPRCIGHRDGKEEAMEVEESANMIIMTAAYAKFTKDYAYVKRHYKILVQWSQYLIDHGLFTGMQLTTDDFLGPIKNSTSLSIKAIVALAAMSQMANNINNTVDDKKYNDIAHNYIKEWVKYGENSMKTHFKAGYNDADTTWNLLYNTYGDELLETHIVPPSVYKLQDEWYLKNHRKYGIQVISTKPFGLPEWQMMYAAATPNPTLRQLIFDMMALWLEETKSTGPFSDWINVENGNQVGWQNRPVIGSVFAPLTVKRSMSKN